MTSRSRHGAHCLLDSRMHVCSVCLGACRVSRERSLSCVSSQRPPHTLPLALAPTRLPDTRKSHHTEPAGHTPIRSIRVANKVDKGCEQNEGWGSETHAGRLCDVGVGCESSLPFLKASVQPLEDFSPDLRRPYPASAPTNPAALGTHAREYNRCQTHTSRSTHKQPRLEARSAMCKAPRAHDSTTRDPHPRNSP
eukprot:3629147-Rhodomonas_salina.3